MSRLFLQTWQTLNAHQVKSGLAIMAIACGVTSVIVLLALGEGFYRYQTQSFSFMTNNVQIAHPSRTSMPWQGLPSRRRIAMSQAYVDLIKKSGFVQRSSSVYENRDARFTNVEGYKLPGNVVGVDPPYFSMVKRKLKPGSRNISPQDMANLSQVAVLGLEVANAGSLQIGEQIKINGIPFLIIGLLDDEYVGISFGDDWKVFVPQTTYLELWDENPQMLLLKSVNGIGDASFRQRIAHFFAKQLHFDPSDNKAIVLPDFSEGDELLSRILRGIQMFLGASGAMTMAVGILGVANTMFLSVTERTREIGVRLAVGATQKLILSQFILEGLILVAIGSALGLMFSYVIVSVLSFMRLPEWIGVPVITPDSIAWSLVVTLVLSLLAVYFPARSASSLTPVIALSTRA